MTCIVGMKHDGKVYIGGDTLGVGGYSKTHRKDGKVFKKNDMIFGFTSSYRMGNLLRYVFNAPARAEGKIDDMEYMVVNFIPELIKTFKTGHYLHSKDDVAAGGTFLIGYRGELYCIHDDFQVAIAAAGYDACGCGEDLALGAMYALKNMKMKPEDKIIRCLEAAAEHSAGVGGRFECVEL